MIRAARRQVIGWAVLLLPILLRVFIPVGFMPVLDPDHGVRLVVCDGDGPFTAVASMPMSMNMPMNHVMGPSGSLHHPAHGGHGLCPYGSAPALGALLVFAILPLLLIRRTAKASLATAQLAYVEVPPRAQSPRGPPC